MKREENAMFTMTPTIMRNLLNPPATRRYPTVVRPPFENARGEIVNDIQICTFCGVCAVKCPSQCITVDKKSATWTCNPFACVYCGVCAESCLSGSLHQKSDYRKPVREKTMIVLQGEIIKKEVKSHEPADVPQE
jgi:formate hydrogenlyase subunit 6/NADH:ubiquinone oxidoreductase subunit I